MLLHVAVRVALKIMEQGIRDCHFSDELRNHESKGSSLPGIRSKPWPVGSFLSPPFIPLTSPF